MINIFLVLAICLNTEVKTIYSYSFDLTTKKESVVLLHADTDGDKVKDFDFLISREELKHILKKRGLPFPNMQFYKIETEDKKCLYVFESFVKN